jgi:predicted dipeptidase
MTKTPFALLLSACILLPASAATAQGCRNLAPFLDAGERSIQILTERTGPAGFSFYRRSVAGSLRANGNEDAAARVEALVAGQPVPAADAAIASCLLRAYTVSRYGGRIVSDLQEMVAFRTFAEEGKENWGLPEFLRQREWLQGRAEALGLTFKSYDGRVEEITLPGGPAPILGVLTHGDVQDVQNQQWSSPPWEAKLVGDRIIGRGTEDDKGPIVASLYSMAALRDTGWPLGMTVRLLVANGEESSWDEIPYYLERAPKPDMTFGIDAAYPVVHAQKGFGVLTLRGKGAAKPKKAEWWIVEMSGGSGMSIIPEKGEAVLETSRYPEGALTDLKRRAAEWAAAHPPARLTVQQEPGLRFHVIAEGKGGHSSAPHSGHNALADLAAFLATLDLRMDARGTLVEFVAATVKTETDGTSLGVATHDEGIGDLTVNLSFLREREGVPVAEINLRVPRGISNDEIKRRVTEKAAAFQKRTGAAVEVESALLSEPHWAPPEGKLVASLLEVWEEVPGKPIAIGGGTQARLFPGGVDFGPGLDMEHYRGHGTDEYMTVAELRRVAELTVAALWKLAGL